MLVIWLYVKANKHTLKKMDSNPASVSWHLESLSLHVHRTGHSGWKWKPLDN